MCSKYPDTLSQSTLVQRGLQLLHYKQRQQDLLMTQAYNTRIFSQSRYW